MSGDPAIRGVIDLDTEALEEFTRDGEIDRVVFRDEDAAGEAPVPCRLRLRLQRRLGRTDRLSLR